MSEEKEIKGEVEAWSGVRNKDGFNSRGVKVESKWYNTTGSEGDLENLDKDFPKGSHVSFKAKENKGFFNILGKIKAIDKNEAYEKPEEEKPVTKSETINGDSKQRIITLGQAGNLALSHLHHLDFTPKADEFNEGFKEQTKRFFKLMEELQQEVL